MVGLAFGRCLHRPCRELASALMGPSDLLAGFLDAPEVSRLPAQTAPAPAPCHHMRPHHHQHPKTAEWDDAGGQAYEFALGQHAALAEVQRHLRPDELLLAHFDTCGTHPDESRLAFAMSRLTPPSSALYELTVGREPGLALRQIRRRNRHHTQPEFLRLRSHWSCCQPGQLCSPWLPAAMPTRKRPGARAKQVFPKWRAKPRHGECLVG